MPAGESARSPIGETGSVEHIGDDSEEGLRKRSGSPTSTQQNWENPPKKFCSEGINIDDWVQKSGTDMPLAIPDMSSQYKENYDMLAQMGFDGSEIDLALRLSNNDLEKSVQYLTREIVGLDSNSKPTTSIEPRPAGPSANSTENMHTNYIESDEEEIPESEMYDFPEKEIARVNQLLELKRSIFYKKNGSLARCLAKCKNIMSEKTACMPEVLEFVDAIIFFVITRHVNASDQVFIGESELLSIEEFVKAVIPVLCERITCAPVNVRISLMIEELFNYNNTFFKTTSMMLPNSDRVFHPPIWCDLDLISNLECKNVYAELVDEFVQFLVSAINKRIDSTGDEPAIDEIVYMFRVLNTVSGVIARTNAAFLERVEVWVAIALKRIGLVTDKDIRDGQTRRFGLDLITEIVTLCEKQDFDVFAITQEVRMEFLKRWIKCPQMECMLHAFEELGNIADRIIKSSAELIKPKVIVSESYFKKWLDENKVLQIVLTGNMDSALYVERVQPILQYMTPELTIEEMKFVWSLRKGRLGVSVDNFNKIMDMILRSLTSEQMEWVMELFKKSFRSREVRLFDPICNFCFTMATHKDRDDEVKLRIANTVWELIAIARGPPLSCSFKSLEFGMRRHCEIMNSMYHKNERDVFVLNIIDGMASDDGFNEVNVVYLYFMLDKLRRLYYPRRILDRNDEALTKAQLLRDTLRERRLFEMLIDRIEHIRNHAHQVFETATLNCLISATQDSMSNAVFDVTSDAFGNSPVDNILTTPLFGCTTYGFVLSSTLRLMRWLHDNDENADYITIDVMERIFDIFIFARNATQSEKSEIFLWLTDLKFSSVRDEASRSILSMMCRLDVFTVQINGLKCFSKFLENMPNIYNENDQEPIEGHVMKRMTDCKLFLWKLILFNESDEVVMKCIEAFCERELTSVQSARYMKHNTLHFLSVFVFYVEQLKAELCRRAGKENIQCSYDATDLEMGDDEIKQHEIPLDTLLTESVTRAIDRLIRFLIRFIELGNEKNNMIRQFPSHASSISGHAVTISVELKNDDDDLDTDANWKNFVCDSNTTIGEFKVRLAKRLIFHESIQDFSIQRNEEDLILHDISLKCDYMTLQAAKLAMESDSIFLSEKFRIMVKPRSRNSRRNDQKVAIHEMFLPAAIVSKCNFYDLLHELSAIGDKHVRYSCRKLLLLLPTQPSLLRYLTINPLQQEDRLSVKVQTLCDEMLNPEEPWKLLYWLETVSSVLSSTRLTPSACENSKELVAAILQTNLLKRLTDEILKVPHVVPLQKCSQNDRHSIFERIVQILRIVYVEKSTMLKSILNERNTKNEMRQTAEQLLASRQGQHQLDPPVEHMLIRPIVLPEGFKHGKNRNNPLLACTPEVVKFSPNSKRAIRTWSLDSVISLLSTLRDFVWIHVATESQINKPLDAFHEKDEESTSQCASEMIRSFTRGDRWGDECRLVIVRKVMSLIRLLIRQYVEHIEQSALVRLLANMFMKSTWINFYQDVLVNSHQEAYRKYMQEMLVKITKENQHITAMVLKMLLDLFTELPFHKGHTASLNELQRRQRFNCEVLVQTVQQVAVPYLRRGTLYVEYREIDWSRVGHSPIVIVTGQIRSLMEYSPRFSSTNFELQRTEISYASSKMKIITCLLPFCTQDQVENCSPDFLKTVMSKFLFPEQQDIETLMLEEESTRWESFCREAAILLVNQFCERSYKNTANVLHYLRKFPIFKRDYDANYKACLYSRVYDQVGMKNDGGTCYMNATLQQLVHVPGLAKKLIAVQNIDPTLKCGQATAALLVEVQKLFATLLFSRAQFCYPVGIWNEFRFDPDVPLNTKQHHDAIDFYSILLDNCDSALKKIESPELFKQHLFGKYSYEKICYGCWHRYKSPDEEFNCVSLALNGDNLEDALDNFLEPHVMEGENAYHCEKCNEKKTTLNRGSFLELPPTLTIQLKRFTYDFINNSIQKDNQFFKFPFEIDMQPYMTSARHVPDEHVQDLFDDMLYSAHDDPPDQQQRRSNKSNENQSSSQVTDSPQKKMFRRHRSSTLRLSQSLASMSNEAQVAPPPKPALYELVGVMAHSGCATAGHYYSFVKERREEMKDSPAFGKWFNLNDQHVTPLNMNTTEDLWFGGNFAGENNERTRHWNAYVLFYDRKKDDDELLTSEELINQEIAGKVKEKVSFDITDEMSDEKLKEEVNGDARLKKKKKLSEARKLRIRMFDTIDEKLKVYLNNENSRFLADRDFFSHDLYYVYVNSCLQLLKSDRVEYTLDDYERDDFLTNAFHNCFGYISRVSWPMHGGSDNKPKLFPKTSIELLKKFMYESPMIKMIFMNAVEENDMELMNRSIDSSDQEVRHAFWVVLRCALRLWCNEQGQSPGTRAVPMEASPDSTDLDDDDEDEDEEDDLDDEDTESEGGLIPAGDAGMLGRLSRPIGVAPAIPPRPPVLPPQPHRVSMNPKPAGDENEEPTREELIKAVYDKAKIGLPIDFSGGGGHVRRVSASSSTVEQNIAMMGIEDPNIVQRSIVRRICHFIQLRIFSRHLLECLLSMAKANSFGCQFLLSCKVLDYLAEFMFEDFHSRHVRLRVPEHRMKSCGIWPGLPTLYFELLHGHLDTLPSGSIDPLMKPRLAADYVAIYCASREEAENLDRGIEDARTLHNRIVDCYCMQISLLNRPSSTIEVNNYMFKFTQSVLADLCTGACGLNNEHSWMFLVRFFTELALRLHSYGDVQSAVRLLEYFLRVPLADDEHVFYRGVLPEMFKWSEYHDIVRVKKMYDALNALRRLRNPDIRNLMLQLRDEFPSILEISEEEVRSVPSRRARAAAPSPVSLTPADDVMLGSNEVLSGDGDYFIGPQPLRRVKTTTNLTKEDDAVATARVVEGTEIKMVADRLGQKAAASSSSSSSKPSTSSNNHNE